MCFFFWEWCFFSGLYVFHISQLGLFVLTTGEMRLNGFRVAWRSFMNTAEFWLSDLYLLNLDFRRLKESELIWILCGCSAIFIFLTLKLIFEIQNDLVGQDGNVLWALRLALGSLSGFGVTSGIGIGLFFGELCKVVGVNAIIHWLANCILLAIWYFNFLLSCGDV